VRGPWYKKLGQKPVIVYFDISSTSVWPMEIWQGVNLKFVQELLGNAGISLTLDVYSHVLPDMGDAAAGAMDAALG
jgi:integrase